MSCKCKSVCQLCDRLVISQSVSFADNTVVINLPDGSYRNGEKYCIVVAQSIPDTVTISAPVVFTIGDGATTFPLTTSCCVPVTSCGIRTRTRYSTVLTTSATEATFKMIGKPCCSPSNNLPSISSATGGAAT